MFIDGSDKREQTLVGLEEIAASLGGKVRRIELLRLFGG
jgi:hypothetical protein